MKNTVFWVLGRVALVITDVSDERSFTIIRVTRITSQIASIASYCFVPISPILVTLMMEVLRSPETSVLTTATQCNIQKATFFSTTIV
jgi:hypothetical protein